MPEWVWPGSRWYRCDLHVHTPASTDFRDLNATPEQWVDSAKAASLDVVAITDHNGKDWIERLKTAANGKALVVFPATELAVSPGIHILSLFDPSTNSDHVGTLLGAMAIPADKFGHANFHSTRNQTDAIEETTTRQGLCILAHAKQDRGDAAVLGKGQHLNNLVNDERVLAAEVNTTDAGVDLLNGGVPGYRPLTLIQCSDAHKLQTIGSRSTWIKMTRPSIEGLRLALLDGTPLSVRLDGDPNEHASQVIEALEVAKARYVGQHEVFTLAFNPWLNAIIGGRGSGKSTVVELIRAAMRRDAELPDDHSSRKMLRVPARRDAEGLLTNQTLVRVVYRKDGERFRIAWDSAGQATPIEQWSESGWVPAAGEVVARFPVRI